ncbi:MAG: thiamine-phosphate kinase [Gammaproteobacteria bacterium]|nr:thiamine-phosphate kinase [Gammaproteobacteria bacterium]
MAQLEFEIIEHYFKDSGLCFESAGVDLGIGDDCALISVDPQQQLAMSMDLLQEGVHFPKNAIPELIAQRALAVNLSDLAAMGAEPLCFTLGLSLPDAEPAWLEAFSQGLLKSATRYGCPLVGGDLIRGNLHLAIQVQGQIPRGQATLRSGARPGHLVYVTGCLGDGAAALALFDVYDSVDPPKSDLNVLNRTKLSAKHRDYFINAFYRPVARIDVGIALRGIATAAIDISDGLLSDIGHVARASGVGVEIDVGQLPFSDSFEACVNESCRQDMALSGGDDYELCFTVAPEQCAQVEDALAKLDVPVTRVGEIVTGDHIICLDSLGEAVQVDYHGYSHFSEEAQ